MSEELKVISIGDTVCLLSIDNVVIEYKIIDAGIAITDSGNYEIGFWLKSSKIKKEAKIIFEPYFVIRGLLDDGLLWKKGKEETAQRIRDLLANYQTPNDN